MKKIGFIAVALATVLLVALVAVCVYLFVKTVIFIVETPKHLERIANALERAHGTDEDDE